MCGVSFIEVGSEVFVKYLAVSVAYFKLKEVLCELGLKSVISC